MFTMAFLSRRKARASSVSLAGSATLRTRLHQAAGLALLLTAVLPAAAHAGVSSLSNLFVFGDSLSDNGNSGLLTGGQFTPSPYYQNRASNGPVAVEYLWQMFNPGNTSFRSSLDGGTNYAVIGATSGAENNLEVSGNLPSPANLKFADKGNAWQLNSFSSPTPSFNPETSLFMLWLFPNDVFYFRNTSAAPNIPTATGTSAGTYLGVDGTPGVNYASIPDLAVSNVLGSVNQLAAAGARNFLVVNAPDLGQTPAFRGTPLAAAMSLLSQTFNSQLESQIQTLASANPQLDISLFQLDDMLNSLIANPAAGGFTNVTDPCFTGVSICATPSSYLFWDSLHPTTQGHSLIAQGLYDVAYDKVPAPLPLFGAVAALRWSRRIRRRQRLASLTDS